MSKTSEERVFMRGSRGEKVVLTHPQENHKLFGFFYLDPHPPEMLDPPENVGPPLESGKIIVFFEKNRKSS